VVPEESPRAYRSDLRTAQAAQTRTRIVAAAAELFATQGYQATTLAAIGRAAGVSVETVKAAGSKASLLVAAFEVVFAGVESAPSLADTEVARGVFALPDDAFVDAVVGQIAGANERGYALWTVLLGASASDPLVSTALAEILEHRRADYRMLVAELVRRGIVAPPDDADALADELSFLMSPEGCQQLVAQSGWTPKRYRAWMSESVLGWAAVRGR